MMKLVVFVAVMAVAFGAYTGDPKDAQVLQSESDVSPEGFKYLYETENGISAQEAGVLKEVGGTDPPVLTASGSYKYTDPEGHEVSVAYVADENGFQPQGDVLPVAPTPPPIPEAIARALKYIQEHPPPPEPSSRR